MATRSSGQWLVLGIDLVIIAICFFLAYLIRFNMSLNFDMSIFARQLPVVLLLALASFLITGTYSRKVLHPGFEEVGDVLLAISLYSILAILLVVINYNWGDYGGFRIPLSIIIIHGFLSLLGLLAWRFLFKAYGATAQKGH